MSKIKKYQEFRLTYYKGVVEPFGKIINDNCSDICDSFPLAGKIMYIMKVISKAGIICWGPRGIIKKGDYEGDFGIDEDVWDDEEFYGDVLRTAMSLHSDHQVQIPEYSEFIELIENGEPIKEVEKRLMKDNKTFEDWVEILLDPEYRYNSLYKDERDVISSLLFSYGNEYELNSDGFIYDSSGSEKFGGWRSVQIPDNIKSKIMVILNTKMFIETINAAHYHIKNKKDVIFNPGKFADNVGGMSDEDLDKLLLTLYKARGGTQDIVKKSNYRKYYPVAEGYSLISKMINPERPIVIDESYVKAAIKACLDIVEHESEEEEVNVKFAKKFLYLKGGYEEYKSFYKVPIDKYKVLHDIEDSFLYVTDTFSKTDNNNHSIMLSKKENLYSLYLNDSLHNENADNNYFGMIAFKSKSDLPIGLGNSLEDIKGYPIYSDLKMVFNSLEKIKELEYIFFYFDNLSIYETAYITIKMIVKVHNFHDYEFIDRTDKMFRDEGFEVGSNSLLMRYKNDISIMIGRPQGSGDKIYSTSGQLTLIKGNDVIKYFNLDERKYNTLYVESGGNDKNINWIITEFDKMKASNPKYGTYEISKRNDRDGGKEPLFRHDFLIWLKNNQI